MKTEESVHRMIRVLIADDHAIVRKGLKQILADTSDLAVCAEASDGNEVLARIRENACDVVVLDISMPGRSGLDILKEIRDSGSGVPVLMLSVHPEDQYAVRVLKAGASGYLNKESAPEELVKAIRTVARGNRYITPSLAEKLAVYIGEKDEKPPHERLSDREFQVMCLIASGKTASQIAEGLSLSIKTISTYRARVLEKMGLNNNAELTHYAIRNRLVD